MKNVVLVIGLGTCDGLVAWLVKESIFLIDASYLVITQMVMMLIIVRASRTYRPSVYLSVKLL